MKITTTRDNNGTYRTNTNPTFIVWKGNDGFWYYQRAQRSWGVESIEAPNKFGPFCQKKSALEHLDRFQKLSLNWEGWSRQQTINNKLNAEAIIEAQSGHDVDYWSNWIESKSYEALERAGQHFGLGTNWKTQIKISFANSWKARTSFADGIFKLMYRPYWYLTKDAKRSTFYYNEYKHIENDPDIGWFTSSDPHKTVLALILHEVAHTVVAQMGWSNVSVVSQKQYMPRTVREKRGHHATWQTVYLWLRKEMLPESTEMTGNRHI